MITYVGALEWAIAGNVILFAILVVALIIIFVSFQKNIVFVCAVCMLHYSSKTWRVQLSS